MKIQLFMMILRIMITLMIMMILRIIYDPANHDDSVNPKLWTKFI